MFGKLSDAIVMAKASPWGHVGHGRMTLASYLSQLDLKNHGKHYGYMRRCGGAGKRAFTNDVWITRFLEGARGGRADGPNRTNSQLGQAIVDTLK